MSDSGNICVKEDDKEIYFYTHWTGYKMKDLVKAALIKGKDRWNDPPYLNRIIFQTLLEDDEGTTGYGIHYQECDPNNPTVFVNHNDRTVNNISFDKFIEGG